MELFEDAGAYLLNLIATVAGWIGAHVWVIPLVCGLLCLAIVASGKLGEADRRVQRIIESQEDEGK